ncbi:hypothetical protein BGZ61DRAFT_482731 [Ilyonectria robusta]|uniref:uncharacterized protein n=1 Tax=Ilyonectria robusta TaxID=1079257 RepID=UPI001E8CABF5|nr:uncharacterized protein BGZ61DRAFT_482731 [Ilyonectria robusta]KAH8672397.1 hypothetical protein BGZ61DRAFT_482731 [Ilyonectria robusta]
MAQSTNPFPPGRRVVTGHNADAAAVIKIDDVIPTKPTDFGIDIGRIWVSTEHPADVQSSEDKSLIDAGLAPSGSQVNFVDFPPNTKVIHHRTTTLDYVFVHKGAVVLELDDGSRTKLQAGDSAVVQAGMHSWQNEDTEWARVFSVMVAAQPPSIGGKTLEFEIKETPENV